MSLSALKAELAVDLLTRGYSGMTDEEIAVDLNTAYRSRNRTNMSGSEVMSSVDVVAWAALSADDKRTVWDVVHMGTVNPFGIEASIMIGVFGAGSDTISNLAAVRVKAISRATELDLGQFGTSDIAKARV